MRVAWCPRRNPCQGRLPDERLDLVDRVGDLRGLFLGVDHHLGFAESLGDVSGADGRLERLDVGLDVGLLDHVGRRDLGGLLLLGDDGVDARDEVTFDDRAAVVADELADRVELGLEGPDLGFGLRVRRAGRGRRGRGVRRHRLPAGCRSDHGVRRVAAREGELCVFLTGEGRDRRDHALVELVPECTEEVGLLVLGDGRVLVEGRQPVAGVPEGVVEFDGALVGGCLGGGGQVRRGDVGHGFRFSLVGSA